MIERVPPRDLHELAAHRAARQGPDRLEIAVYLARLDLERARTHADVRFLGRAQATLSRWWALPAPPPEVLLLRATIRQSLHEFSAARSDLDQLVAARPDDAQGHLTRAVVSTVVGDYPTARESCDAVRRLAEPLVASACRGPLDALSGNADRAYTELARDLQAARTVDVHVRAWALTILAELAVQRGDDATASIHLRRVLQLDADDSYALGLLADVLLAQGKPEEASALLAGREHADALLVRRAIAEHRAHGPDARSLAARMRERLDAASARGDRTHLREHARFALDVDGDAKKAAQLATENWGVQKELADARLLVAAAVALRAPEVAEPVTRWVDATGVGDAALARGARQLGAQ